MVHIHCIERRWSLHSNLITKSLGPSTRFREKNDDLSLASQEPPFFICCICARARERALMTRKSCAVGMRNAILRNYLKAIVCRTSPKNYWCIFVPSPSGRFALLVSPSHPPLKACHARINSWPLLFLYQTLLVARLIFRSSSLTESLFLRALYTKYAEKNTNIKPESIFVLFLYNEIAGRNPHRLLGCPKVKLHVEQFIMAEVKSWISWSKTCFV